MIIPKIKPAIEVSIPKDTSFHIPEGKYRATIRNIERKYVEKANGTGEVLKFFFEVQVPSQQKTINLAKLELREDMSTGSELRNLLTRLLGQETVSGAAGSKLSLDTLVGNEVEVEIEHVITNKRDDYAYPLVKVRDVQKITTATKQAA